MTRKSGKDVYRMSKNMEILVSYINAYQRVNSTKEEFNNQVDRVTYSVITSRPFSPATLSSPNEPVNKGAIETQWRLCTGSGT